MSEIKIKAETLSSLAANYGISRKAMKSWLVKGSLEKKEGTGYLYTPKEVKAIYEHLGNP